MNFNAACAALNGGECDAAIVAGMNPIQSPSTINAGVLYAMLTCHMFDSSDGYGRAEGAI